MLKRKFQSIKTLVSILLVFTLLLGATQAFAASKDVVKSEPPKWTLPEYLAYTEVEAEQEQLVDTKKQQDSKEKPKSKELATENLKQVIQRIQNGEKVFWNKDFVEVTKTEFPELYPVILQQATQQSQQQSNASDISAQYTAGDITMTFLNHGYNVWGGEIFALKCAVTWKWDSTKLTSVVPSTWGEIYTSGWKYAGLSYSRGAYQNSNTSYTKEHQGIFQLEYAGTVVQTAYLWHDITLYAGGTYDFSCGAS